MSDMTTPLSSCTILLLVQDDVEWWSAAGWLLRVLTCTVSVRWLRSFLLNSVLGYALYWRSCVIDSNRVNYVESNGVGSFPFQKWKVTNTIIRDLRVGHMRKSTLLRLIQRKQTSLLKKGNAAVWKILEVRRSITNVFYRKKNYFG